MLTKNAINQYRFSFFVQALNGILFVTLESVNIITFKNCLNRFYFYYLPKQFLKSGKRIDYFGRAIKLLLLRNVFSYKLSIKTSMLKSIFLSRSIQMKIFNRLLISNYPLGQTTPGLKVYSIKVTLTI